MLLRTLIFFATLIAVAIGVDMLAQQPGVLMLNWHGWVIETTAAFFVVTLGVFLVLFFLAVRTFIWLEMFPKRLARHLSSNRHEKALTALSDSMMALHVGEAEKAVKEAKRAHKALPHLPLAESLLAQATAAANPPSSANQSSANQTKAIATYSQMLGKTHTHKTGLKGLLDIALAQNDSERALTYAEELHREFPKNPWVIEILTTLYTQNGRFDDAALTAKKEAAKKSSNISRPHHITEPMMLPQMPLGMSSGMFSPMSKSSAQIMHNVPKLNVLKGDSETRQQTPEETPKKTPGQALEPEKGTGIKTNQEKANFLYACNLLEACKRRINAEIANNPASKLANTTGYNDTEHHTESTSTATPRKDAQAQLHQLLKAMPDFAPAAIFLAETYKHDGQQGDEKAFEKAQKVLQKTYHHAPVHALAEHWFDLANNQATNRPKNLKTTNQAADKAVKKYLKQVDKFIGPWHDHLFGLTIKGKAFLTINHTTEAQKCLTLALQKGADKTLFETLAQLEKQQQPAGGGAIKWLERALGAPENQHLQGGYMVEYAEWQKNLVERNQANQASHQKAPKKAREAITRTPQLEHLKKDKS